MTASPQEVVSKYKKLLTDNNSVSQNNFSSMVVNGVELQGGNNLVSKQIQYSRRSKNNVNMVNDIDSNIIFLFKKDVSVTINGVTKTVIRFYVGGDRIEPEEIYDVDTTEYFLNDTIYPPKIIKTSTNQSGFKVQFVLLGITEGVVDISRVYFYTYSDGEIYISMLTIEPDSFFTLAFFNKVVMGDGSFSLLGYRSQQLSNLELAPYFDFPALINAEKQAASIAFQAQVPFGLFQSIEYTENAPTFVINKPGFYEMPTTIETLGYFELKEGTLGITVGQRVTIIYFYFASSAIFYLGEFSPTLLPYQFIPTPDQELSLFARPEDDVINPIRFDNYPAIERSIQVDFTESDFKQFTPNDGILQINESQVLYKKLQDDNVTFKYFFWDNGNEIEINSQDILNEITQPNNGKFLDSKIYKIFDNQDDEDGVLGEASIKIIDLSLEINPITVEEEIAYFVIDEGLSDSAAFI